MWTRSSLPQCVDPSSRKDGRMDVSVKSISMVQSLFSAVWCNQIGTIFEEMSSRTALTWYLGMKTGIVWNIWKVNIFGLLIWIFEILKVIEEKAFLKKYTKKKIQTNLLYMHLVYKVFITRCIVKAVQDVISLKTVRSWLHNAVFEWKEKQA